MDKEYTIKKLLKRWVQLQDNSLYYPPIDADKFQIIARDTYAFLSECNPENDICDSMSELFKIMEQVGEYDLIFGNTKYYDIDEIVNNMLWQLVRGFENNGSVFPKLKVINCPYDIYIDFNEDRIDIDTYIYCDKEELDIFGDEDIPF